MSTSSQAAGTVIRGYWRNRQPALFASWTIAISTTLLASALLLSGVFFIAQGAALADQGAEAYEALRLSVYIWFEVLVVVGGFGVLGVFLAFFPFLIWLFQAIGNLRVLPAPDLRPRSELLLLALFVLFPALAVSYFVVRATYPNAWGLHFTLYAAAAASLVGPLVVIRRLWASGGARSTIGTLPPDWRSVLVWWTALEIAWVTLGFAPTVMSESWDYYRFVDGVTQLYAAGVLQVVSTTALVVAAARIIRIMYRVNEMQDVLVRQMAQPILPSDQLGSGPARRVAATWQCESCDVMNPTAMRYCQNCARERP